MHDSFKIERRGQEKASGESSVISKAKKKNYSLRVGANNHKLSIFSPRQTFAAVDRKEIFASEGGASVVCSLAAAYLIGIWN